MMLNNNTQFEKSKVYDNTRQCYNIKILSELLNIVTNHPELRFQQILINQHLLTYKKNSIDIEDRFYEEPWDTYNRMKG